MFTEDYHIHTEMSHDSDAKHMDACARAAELGIDEIAFTDHYDIGLTEIEEGCNFNVAEMKEKVGLCREKYKDRLKIRFGIEIGQPHNDLERSLEVIKRAEYDFVLCSLHNNKSGIDFYYVDYKNINFDELYESYLSDIDDMIKNFKDFDVLAHVTYPVRYAMKTIKSFDVTKHYPHLREIFKKLISMGKGIEVNLSTLRTGLSDPMPDFETVKLYKKLGGEIITIGSDAHFSHHVGSEVHDSVRTLYEMGFKYLATYENRKLKMKKIL
ncbi:MAG: histidinol-phosphatase HisJ family protein [Bacillota bacterium]|nr:histidinol-phosphatase HisJ family protein [Bacillota bacterium]